MPRSKQHKARTRERVIDAAAARFRREGFERARIDDLMADAGLTRGGFYAHFQSKGDLLTEVISSRNDLLRRLVERPGSSAGPNPLAHADPQAGAREPARVNDALRAQGRAILDAYVTPEYQRFVGPGCTMANLAAEAGRHGDDTRQAWRQMLQRLVGELERGEGPGSRQAAMQVLAMAIGAVTLARGCPDSDLATELLDSVRRAVPVVLDGGLDTPGPGRMYPGAQASQGNPNEGGPS
ncbi:MAG: TetR/AcrR family transcriptional regulator [Burkholderiaceae bacterium]|nr:TetR/AcrR family transcriptional regulator [Burkholderiaceae bacterium]